MNMLEALKLLALEGKWVRPKRWACEALCLGYNCNTIEIVPTSRGGVRPMMLGVTDCLGEWEVVSPDKVAEERAEIIK